jgi:hypothetical protein
MIKIGYCRCCGVSEGEMHKDKCEKERCKKHRKNIHFCKCKPKKDQDKEPFFKKNYWSSCIRCGTEKPKTFMVSDSEWKKVCGATYKEEDRLCEECFDFIRKHRKIKKGKRRYV